MQDDVNIYKGFVIRTDHKENFISTGTLVNTLDIQVQHTTLGQHNYRAERASYQDTT